MNRVAITGMGVIACNGTGLDAFWRNCRDGKSGISAIESFDTREFPVKIAGTAKDFKPDEFIPRKLCDKSDRFVHFGVAAAAMAMKDSGLDPDGAWREDAAVIVGSGAGGQMYHEETISRVYRDGIQTIHPLSVPTIMGSAVPAHISIQHGLGGQNLCISTACSSGANAIGEAFRKIRYGECDVAFTGGVEAAVTPFFFFAHCSLKVLSLEPVPPEKVSRPFDKSRSGFVLSEGGAILVLENLDRAVARGARIHAELVGFGSNSGAHHIAMPDPSAKDLVRVMGSALKDAAIAPGDIGYVNAHGTSTRANDSAEVLGLEKVFGAGLAKIPISGSKSMFGHALGAAGAIEAALCALSLSNQVVTPTINLENPDFPYDFVANHSRPAEMEYCMSNSFGFGSNNSCLIMRRYHGK